MRNSMGTIHVKQNKQQYKMQRQIKYFKFELFMSWIIIIYKCIIEGSRGTMIRKHFLLNTKSELKYPQMQKDPEQIHSRLKLKF